MSDDEQTARTETGHSLVRLLGVASQQRVARFVIVGGGAALLEFSAFNGLIAVHVWPAFASLLSFAIGMAVSFVGYRNWTFAGDQALPMHSQFGAYLLLALVNAAISAALIQFMVTRGFHPWLAKLVMMATVACWNFLILDRLVFRGSRSQDRLKGSGGPATPSTTSCADQP